MKSEFKLHKLPKEVDDNSEAGKLFGRRKFSSCQTFDLVGKKQILVFNVAWFHDVRGAMR